MILDHHTLLCCCNILRHNHQKNILQNTFLSTLQSVLKYLLVKTPIIQKPAN